MLQQIRSGVWQATVDLPLGAHYGFRYVVDGRWSTDSHADGMSDNSFGSQNSLVVANLPESEQLQETPGLIREGLPLRSFSTPSSTTLFPRTRTATQPIPFVAANSPR